ncbi:hypothetical protein FRC05_010966 [Tulasnella sp. 425]|nr:hypothetical protein FRC05_010966 [Tulasnella sp. 425]
MAALPPSYTPINSQAPAYTSATAAARGSDALPGYNDPNAPSSTFVPSQGIDDKVPNHFKINDQYVKAQVTSSDLQAHLVLLGAFHRLREEVRTFKGNSDVSMEPDERWAVFLQRAVYRFEQWAVRMIGGEGQEEVLGEGPKVLAPNEVPPLDVTMVWHTYMLNPRTYYEDCLRKLPGLLRIGSFPLMQLAGSVDHETLLPHPPSESRASAFNSFTGQPFKPPVNTTSDETVAVFCPSCSQPNKTPWITFKGDGFAQRGYGCICENCRLMFTREALVVRKFYEDMEKCIVNPDRFFLANTIVDYHSGTPVEPRWSQILTSTVLNLRDGTTGPAPAETWGKKIGWTMKAVEGYCRIGLLGKKNQQWIATPRPSNSTRPGLFLLKVLRQMNFIEKMVNLGFTEQARWEEDHDTLTRCVVRYHHFLDLMGSTQGNFVVPTLIPDHDDKVSQGAFSDAYDKTAEAWKARFGVPYSICGCLPSDIPNSSSGSPFSFFSKKGKSKSSSEKPLENPRPDLLSPSDDAADQTHPSDHHAVAIINPGEPNGAQADLKRRELAKRAKDWGKSVEKGKADQWGEIMQKRTGGHAPSFLCPVQYGVQFPIGKFGQGDCTALSGRGLQNASAAGECCKGNGMNGLCGAQFDQRRGGPIESIKYSVMMSGDSRLQQDLGMGQMNASLGVMGAIMG